MHLYISRVNSSAERISSSTNPLQKQSQRNYSQILVTITENLIKLERN